MTRTKTGFIAPATLELLASHNMGIAIGDPEPTAPTRRSRVSRDQAEAFLDGILSARINAPFPKSATVRDLIALVTAGRAFASEADAALRSAGIRVKQLDNRPGAFIATGPAWLRRLAREHTGQDRIGVGLRPLPGAVPSSRCAPVNFAGLPLSAACWLPIAIVTGAR